MPITNCKSLFGRRSIIVLLAATVLSFSLLAFASTDNDLTVPEQKRTRSLESEVITVTQRGFEPTTITRPAGEFILMIENPNQEALNFSLSRESGAKLQQVKAAREEPNWNEVQDLPPGRYVLTEQSHPEWMCLITITAR